MFFDCYLADRMPKEVFDIHLHLNLTSHIPPLSQERIQSDWAIECGIYLTVDEAAENFRLLFGNIPFSMAGFPMPLPEADIAANNDYLLCEKNASRIHPLMGVRPEWDADMVDETLVHFHGIKPYPGFVATYKGAENTIYDFLPHAHLAVLNRQKKTVVIHLPRHERFADRDNIRELLEIRQKYPDITIVIAHLGRSFCPYYLREGMDVMGGDINGFYFDTSAVINPDVYKLAFERLDRTRLMYGTDAPILYWHGKRTWTERSYLNLCREEFSWNRHIEGPEKEREYVLVMYEQMKNILDVMDTLAFTVEDKHAFFAGNAKKMMGIHA